MSYHNLIRLKKFVSQRITKLCNYFFYLSTFSTPCMGHLLHLMFRCDVDVMEIDVFVGVFGVSKHSPISIWLSEWFLFFFLSSERNDFAFVLLYFVLLLQAQFSTHTSVMRCTSLIFLICNELYINFLWYELYINFFFRHLWDGEFFFSVEQSG